MLKKNMDISIVRKITRISLFLPFFLLLLILIIIFFAIMKEWQGTIHEDSTEFLILLSSSVINEAQDSNSSLLPLDNEEKKVLQTFGKYYLPKVDNIYLFSLKDEELQNGESYIDGKEIVVNLESNVLNNNEKLLIAQAINSGHIEHSSIYKKNGKHIVTSFMKIKDYSGVELGIIGIEKNVSSFIQALKTIIFYFVFALLLISASLYYFVNKKIKKLLAPIDDVIYGLKELSDGNLDVRLKVRNDKDIGNIAEVFNEMVQNLSILFHHLSKTAKELGTSTNKIPLNSMEEALHEMDNIVRYTKMSRELQKAEKMNAIGQLAASVAHEIRNPMTVVKGFLQIFLAKKHLSEEERMYIKLMIDEMDRAETIINDYLSLAKPSVEQVEKIDGEILALKVIELMHSYAMLSKNITIKKEINSLYVKANNNELKQVLINIAKNGIEAMKKGGVLSFSLYRKEHFAVFEIADTGVGMSQEEIGRLGTAFYSLKEKGTGVGLMVCFQLVEQMKGKIEVDSKIGEGTTFKIYIPLFLDEHM